MEDFPRSLFGQPLDFKDLIQCKEYVFYNMTRCTLFKLIEELFAVTEGPLGQIRDSSSGFQNPVESMRSAANNICCSVPYVLDFPTHGSTGAIMLQHALADIFLCYEPGTEESKWIISIFEKLRLEFGLEGGYMCVKKQLEKEGTREVFNVN